MDGNLHGGTFVGYPGYRYCIEASSDLQNWMPVMTNTTHMMDPLSPQWGFEYFERSKLPYRFYRAKRLAP